MLKFIPYTKSNLRHHHYAETPELSRVYVIYCYEGRYILKVNDERLGDFTTYSEAVSEASTHDLAARFSAHPVIITEVAR